MMSRHVTPNVTPFCLETRMVTHVTATTPRLPVWARAHARNILQLTQIVYIRDPRIRSDI